MVTVKEAPDTAAIVEAELRRINAPQLRQELKALASALIAIGLAEIFLGIFAISLPFFTGAFFTVLLGAVILGSGILELVGGIAHRQGGRLALGIVSILAGLLVIAQPIFGLAFLTLALGLYLIGAGIAKLAAAGGSGWEVFAGILAIALGIFVLAGWPSTSILILGLFIGVTLLLNGISNIRIGTRLGNALSASAASEPATVRVVK